MAKPVVYVWKSEPRSTHFTPEEISAASYGLLSRLGLQIAHKQILIKPNVTITTTRESGIVTDSAHVEGIVRWLLDSGYAAKQVAVGEGGGAWMRLAFRVAGYADLAQAYGIRLFSFNDRRLGYADQDCAFVADRIKHLGRRQRIARRAIDPNTFVINAPKLKTHNAMAITICLKNLMGTQHRDDRSLCSISREYARLKGMDYELRFAHEICNLYQNARPDFNLVDGVIARMGSGFQDGENYPLGLTVAGTDGFAVDFACSYFIGFNPEHLILFKTAAGKGLAPTHISDIDTKWVSENDIIDVDGKALEQFSSPRGFWVKYHRERPKSAHPRTLEQHYPGLYRKKAMPRNSDQGRPTE